MKMKRYHVPMLRIIDLSTEGMMAASPESPMNVDKNDQTHDDFDWTKEKAEIGWESSEIWK